MTDVTRYGKLTIEDAWKIIKLQEYNFPKKPSSDGYYHIYVKDKSKKSGRRAIKAKTLEELQDKVYKNDVKTFNNIFYLLQKEKIKYIKNDEKLLSVENSIKRLKSEYRHFFEGSDFEQRCIAEISKKDIEDFCLKVLTENNLNEKGFLEFKCILSSVFKYAYEEYLIIDNPYTRVNFKKYKDLFVPTVPSSVRYHSDQEIDKMLHYIHLKQERHPDMVSAYAMEFQILTGTRRGEIPPLTYDDVKDGYILIHREMIGNKIVNHTKNYKDRKFPITDDIQVLLNKLRNNFDSEYLFPGLKYWTVYSFYERMCKKLEIELSSECIKGPHSFRRNGITTVTNRSNGNFNLACELFGNTPEVAKGHYYTGIDIEEARRILNW